jgi:hypothetical protein
MRRAAESEAAHAIKTMAATSTLHFPLASWNAALFWQ